MDGKKRTEKDLKYARRTNLLENLFIVIMVFYPLRHIGWGLDFWDTGYNYANFQFMGTEHMDPMWLFSTYLANAAGNLLTKLPGAGSLMGLNFYTGLSVSLLAVAGYFFCTRRLKVPGWIAFAGEMTAISLCWCPTALLYNYLTYVLFLGCVILLYRGLTEEKRACLVLAGVCLGANVLVRFSNLPEAAMILAVWAYDAVTWFQERDGRAARGESLWRRLGQHTLWCFVGYGGALLALLGFIHVRYGLGNYAAGIRRLFAMTDTATDYKADSMLMGMINTYVENLYWVIRIGVILAAGILFFVIAGLLLRAYGRLQKMLWWCCGRILLAFTGAVAVRWLYVKGICSQAGMAAGSGLLEPNVLFVLAMAAGLALSAAVGWLLQKRCGMERAFWWEGRILWGVVSAIMLAWLYLNGFCSLDFLRDGPISYGPMLRPGILFLMLTMLTGVVSFLNPKSPKQEKLIGVMVVLVVLLTSLGSNNRVYPSMNNLFVAAPYTLWQCWRFCAHVKERHVGKVTFSAFPVKAILAAFLGMCLFQFGGFGTRFVFAEATGVYNLTATVENNDLLKNIKMSPEKARWITELGGYVEERGLQGREVILYGNIPALSYYLQMPPAFNAWIDLRSYGCETLRDDLEEEERQIRDGSTDKPVVLVDRSWDESVQDEKWELLQEKWQLIREFMERNGYELTWQNDRFAFYE
ncbi:MAG: hypothetical protein NC331_01360 [Lachnospiraceae bacterium]|nr:hypothetical protein [Lachnospiraceae bacterium]MCM1238015.1 hypothetical protein [Lachnospiraceae bacterium]